METRSYVILFVPDNAAVSRPTIRSEEETRMDENRRRLRFWKTIYPPVRYLCSKRYGYTFDPVTAERPYLLIANHTTNFLDVFLLALTVGKTPVAFVGSEHIRRSGLLGFIVRRYFTLISRPKGAQALSTVREILNTLRNGMPVCLFAEGNCSWDGRSIPVVEGTGTLVRACGAPLITYRVEGGYLCHPRWAKGSKKGKITARQVGFYPPEELKKLSSQQVNALIDRDIREDAWETQRKNLQRAKGRRRAETIERFLYLCPSCKRIGTLRSRREKFSCSCGKSWEYTETGFLKPDKPFSTLAEWEDWQKEALRENDFVRDDLGDRLFSDTDCVLSRIEKDAKVLGRGDLIEREGKIECAGHGFDLDGISSMDMIKHDLIVFTACDGYYQIRARGRTNLRKYVESWKARKEQNGGRT